MLLKHRFLNSLCYKDGNLPCVMGIIRMMQKLFTPFRTDGQLLLDHARSVDLALSHLTYVHPPAHHPVEEMQIILPSHHRSRLL